MHLHSAIETESDVKKKVPVYVKDIFINKL